MQKRATHVFGMAAGEGARIVSAPSLPALRGHGKTYDEAFANARTTISARVGHLVRLGYPARAEAARPKAKTPPSA